MHTALIAALLWFAASLACLAALWGMNRWDDIVLKRDRGLTGSGEVGNHRTV